MIKAGKIASQINGKLIGDKNIKILGAYDLIPGKKNHISFLDDKGDTTNIKETQSDLIILDRDIESFDFDKTLIFVKNPKLVFFNFVKQNFIHDYTINGIHNTAIISDNVDIEKNVSIGPYSIIEKNVKIL